MTTTRAAAANRKNAKKSTGLRTDEGKKASSQNALKHGLTAAGAVVLPNEDPDAYDALMNQWLDYYRPADPAQRALIVRAVAAQWKLDRCARAEAARLAEAVRHAPDAYDRQRRAEAEELGRRLVFDPVDRSHYKLGDDPLFRERLAARERYDPADLAGRLQATAQGAQWLIDRWEELAGMLAVHGHWHYPEKFRAVYLLGKRPEDVMEDPLVSRIFLACYEADPETDPDNPDAFNLWDEFMQSRLGPQGKPVFECQTDTLKAHLPADPAAARAQIRAVVDGELARLRALKARHLDPLDRLDRAGAADRALFDAGPEAELLRRYETSCGRELHRSVADLAKLRQAEAKAAEALSQNEAVSEAEAEAPVKAPAGPPGRPRKGPRASAKPMDAPATQPASARTPETPPKGAV